jgi:hypothetical protein
VGGQAAEGLDANRNRAVREPAAAMAVRRRPATQQTQAGVAVAAAPVEMAHPALPNRWPGPAARV